MSGYFGHIEADTLENEYFRKVLYTGKRMQLVLMTIQPGDDIGMEDHDGHDQFFRFESGEGEVVVGDETYKVGDGDVVIVPDGARHNVINTSETEPLKLYTIYAPAEHADGTIHETKAEAMEAEEDHHH